MNKKLKWKIFYSFSLLIGLLIAAGTVSIIEFRLLSNTFSEVLDNNYKSIEASKEMLESLEREDSGILLVFLGEKSEGIQIIEEADRSFKIAFDKARKNITELNEDELIHSIDSAYANFNQQINHILQDQTEGNELSLYKSELNQEFKKLKKQVGLLLELNQTSLYATSGKLKDKATRAIMPGIVSIFAAILFSIVLIFFISRYFVNPLQELTKKIEAYKPGSQAIGANIDSSQEFSELENAVDNLIQKLQRNK
jgi:methyl-accepting chemotaxis protein